MCVAGARWVQKDVLEKNPDLPVKVYAVWFNMLKSDARSGWPDGALTDSRVTHYWDEDKVLGRWFAPKFQEGNEGAMWDTFLLYPPNAHWDQDITKPLAWGCPVIKDRDGLTRGLAELPKGDSAK